MKGTIGQRNAAPAIKIITRETITSNIVSSKSKGDPKIALVPSLDQ
jgi:hypothetical protein